MERLCEAIELMRDEYPVDEIKLNYHTIEWLDECFAIYDWNGWTEFMEDESEDGLKALMREVLEEAMEHD